MTVALPQSPGAGREESGALWAYAAMLAAMLISSGNFLLAHLAVQEIDPVTLAFWRNAIATACFAPFAVRAGSNLVKYFRRQKVRLLVLALTGVILPAWLMYLSLHSDDLINLSVGYTFIPLMAVLFSALLLAERLSPIQYLGSSRHSSAPSSSRSRAISRTSPASTRMRRFCGWWRCASLAAFTWCY
jgi:uncharacterized membrane protein